MRAVGRGQRVLFVQFIKGPWKSGEDSAVKFLSEENVAKKLGKGGLVFKKMGLGFVGILGDSLPIEEHKKAAQKALAYIKEELSSQTWDVVVADEINVAVSLGLILAEDAISAVDLAPKEKLLIFTGRGAPEEFLKIADLVTEMKEVKHPFQKGQGGRANIEF